MKGRNILVGIVLLTSIVFTTIVYSAFSTQLNIEGEAIVRSDQDIRITDIRIQSQTNGAYETYNNKYNKDATFMYVTLPSNSSITYTVEITNKISNSYLIGSITQQSHTNQNVNVDISLNVNDIVNSNSIKTFTITLTNNTSIEQEEILVYRYLFKLNSFTVTFDANGGNVNTSSKEVSYGSTYGSLPEPTREGYTFMGWNGKNLFDYEQILNNNADTVSILELNGINTISWINTTTTEKQKFLQGSFESNKQYIFYGKIASSQDNRMAFGIIYTDGSLRIKDYSNTEHSLYGNKNTFYDIKFKSDEGKTIDYISGLWSAGERIYVDINNFMIEEVTSNISYEPYYITSSTEVVQSQNHTLKAIWKENPE